MSVFEKGYPSYDAVNGINDVKKETLVILMEECGEVIQECSKILRFGNDADKLHKELGDLICMIKLTEDNLNLDFNKTFEYSTDKYNKLRSWSNLVGGSKAEKNLKEGWDDGGRENFDTRKIDWNNGDGGELYE
jgi:NTP pyrophosphatase (non-canonical NTP hydrolase)